MLPRGTHGGRSTTPGWEESRRLRLGQPYRLDTCIEELAHPQSPFDARARAALEVEIRSGQPVGFQPDWPDSSPQTSDHRAMATVVGGAHKTTLSRQRARFVGHLNHLLTALRKHEGSRPEHGRKPRGKKTH